MSHILVIDDDDFIRGVLKSVLKKAGYTVSDASSGEAGLKMVKQEQPDLVVSDYKMPGISGLDVLQEIVRTNPGLPVIILTAYGDVALTIKAIQAGAYDFIEKPVKNHELLEAIENGVKASAQSKSLKQVIAPEARKEIEENLPAGKTPAMREIFKNIGRISLNKVNVVITGESGTGKEQVARLIHFSGINREHPFMVVYCNSADEQKLDRELFGFADGNTYRKGKLEQVGEGTIFFDEFPDLPEKTQKKLFRAFQNGEYENPDNQKPVPLNARFIVATSEDLDRVLAEKNFSTELYYRFRMFSIHLPPIRERKDDIPELIQSLLIKLNRRFNKHVVKVEDGVIELLKNYDWPGNIRELENTLTQAMILTHDDVLKKQNIPPFSQSAKRVISATSEAVRLIPMSEVEKEHIKKVLDAVNWNKMEASGILEITRPTLNKKIEKYSLAP